MRAIGVVLLVVGVASLVLLITPGPREFADWLGESCAHERNGPSEDCGTLDAVLILWGIGPLFTVMGFAMTLALRPEHKGPMVLDLRFLRRRR